MKLSVIIPVYNVERYLEQCVESLYYQELNKDTFEILLIDDGSKDSSLEVANQLAQQYTNIRVFHQENQGQAAARNKGIDEARGEYLMFVDSDDYLQSDQLVNLLDILYRESLDAIIYNLQIEQKNGDISIHKIPDVEYGKVFSGEEVVLRYFVFGSMCRGIFSRKVFEKNNLRFRYGFTHEDSELCFRLYPRLGKVMFVDKAIYFYRYNTTSTDRAKDIKKLQRNIESDAILVSKLIGDINSDSYSPAIRKRYREIANSNMIGFFFRVRSAKIWNKEDFKKKIEWLRDIGVYPIKGDTNSKKSLLIAKLLNQQPFLRLFIMGL